MNGNPLLSTYWLVIVCCLVAGGLFSFRAIFKFLEWRDGDEKAFWNFLPLAIGAVASILFFFAGVLSLYSSGNAWEGLFYVSLLCALGALGVMTFATIQNWRETK